MQLTNYPLRPKLTLENLMKIRTNRVEMNRVRQATSPKKQASQTKKTRSQVLSKAAKMSTEEQLALIKQLEDSMEEEE